MLVYKRPDEPTWGFGLSVSEDGRYLVITIWKGTDNKYRIVVKDLTEPHGMPVDVIENFDHEYSFIGNDETTFYFLTDLELPRKRIVAIDITVPSVIREVIPQTDETLIHADLVGNQFILTHLKDAKTQVTLYTVAGKYVREVSFPGIGRSNWIRWKTNRHRNFLFLFQLCHPSFDLSLRPSHGREHTAATGESKI